MCCGRFVGDGTRLDANVYASRDLIFFVPRGRYQLLRFRAQLFAVPASIPLAERPPDKRHPLIYGNDLFVIWTVADSSWFHDLVYGRERNVITRYALVSRPTATSASPDIFVAALPEPDLDHRHPERGNAREHVRHHPFRCAHPAVRGHRTRTRTDRHPGRRRLRPAHLRLSLQRPARRSVTVGDEDPDLTVAGAS
jgi:hypothetical protein